MPDESRHERGEHRDREHAGIDADRGDAHDVLGRRSRRCTDRDQARARPTMVPATETMRLWNQNALRQPSCGWHRVPRTAASRCCTDARASHRFATFAQAISSTMADRCQQHQHPRPRGAADEVIAQRANADARPGLGCRDCGADDRGAPGPSAPELVRATRRLQARDALQRATDGAGTRHRRPLANDDPAARGAQGIQRSARPGRARSGSTKLGRHHADDGRRCSPSRANRPADSRSRSPPKCRLPQAVAEHGHAVAVRSTSLPDGEKRGRARAARAARQRRSRP